MTMIILVMSVMLIQLCNMYSYISMILLIYVGCHFT